MVSWYTIASELIQDMAYGSPTVDTNVSSSISAFTVISVTTLDDFAEQSMGKVEH